MTEDNQITPHKNTDVSCLLFGKAKKKEGHYICPVKGQFNVTFNNASIISMKETSNTIVLKTKDKETYRYMDELNKKILDTVIKNSSLWFNTSIDDDLIEEYYISTLQYDKQNGEMIRLKIRNIDDIEEAKDFGDNVLIVVSLKYLKFFKQKFYPEFQVELVEALDDDKEFVGIDEEEDVFFEDIEEYPVPSYEEITSIKEEYMTKLRNNCEDLTKKLCDVEKQYNENFEKLTKLGNSENINEIIELCEECEKFFMEQ